ncbi:type II protein arginine methyltransferase NDAI_0H00730 [Naumovozyma dairenensis CBS 421]|uniref:type II protein arginine methyltransferase n=1 Tax=Naumovozyma dairenensis (strain ATCC 10597 / BCRC 20456 / CBS 421 / NBRC 0211 / NRRL Y-12639) TaxID=1071378 RepID=G0WEN6_NAUDC|nr:hypothetical protein NDAI_0H00730 [Naumovozyma dairenensis CBS 421]CCD26247.1 hypothetical protein NDAI_0H00730 [Naumovozyma dairenensis CBS 421]
MTYRIRILQLGYVSKRFNSHFSNKSFEELSFKGQRIRSNQQNLTNSYLSFRDYMEWKNAPRVMQKGTFFDTTITSQNNSKESLLNYDPLFSHCLAKWLWVQYKLNDYPYYDLNILNIYTNLPQDFEICKNIMTYYSKIFSTQDFDRIKLYMVPLFDDFYDNKAALLSKNKMGNIPGHVIFGDEIPFHLRNPLSFGKQSNPSFLIEDPVYILFMNDVIKYSGHDLIKYSSRLKAWEQCYINIDSNGNIIKRFDTNLDYWCKDTLESIFNDNHSIGMDKEMYIPTSLVQFFKFIHENIPEHRLFAIDIPKRWNPTLLNMLKYFSGIYKAPNSSQVMEYNNNNNICYGPLISHGGNSERSPIEFAVEFLQLQELYQDTNTIGNGLRTVQLESLDDFINKWLNVDIQDTSYPLEQGIDLQILDKQLKMIKHSKLGLLYS